MDDLSTSLLGHFTIEHTKIEILDRVMDYFSQYCKADETVNVPIENVNYRINNNLSFFTIKADIIHNKPLVFQRNNANATAIGHIEHTPARWNYWHFSVRWKDVENDTYIHLQNDTNWKHKLCSHARANFCKFAVIEEPLHKILPSKYYKKSIASMIIQYLIDLANTYFK